MNKSVIHTKSQFWKPYRNCFKRWLDVAIGLLGLPVLLLVYPFVAIAIKWDSQGPVLFKQERIGLNMQPFRIYKFRTMRNDAERIHLRKQNRSKLMQQPNDPRVTRIGDLLRRTSIDEVPQIINILRGEMSLIGPRPFVKEDVDVLSQEHLRRQIVKPGLIGLAQVNGRNRLNIEERQKYDLYYVDHITFALDIQILLKCIAVVIKKDGAN